MKKRKLPLLLILSLLAIVYIARVTYINVSADPLKITYYTSEETIEHQGMEISLTEQKLYEVSAFVKEYPEIADAYTKEGNFYMQVGAPEAYESLKYIVAVKLQYKNQSSGEQTIDLTAFSLTNVTQSILQGVHPPVVRAINGDIEFSVAPGESKEVILAFELLGITIRNLTYERFRQEPFAIPVSSYPEAKTFILDNLELVEGEENDEADTPSLSQIQKENTPAGTVLQTGGEIIDGNVGVTVKQVDIVKNAKEYPEYDESAWMGYFKESFVNPDGTVKTIMEETGLPKSYIRKGYENYFIFVKLNVHNYSPGRTSAYIDYSLFNSSDTLAIDNSPEYASNRTDENEESSGTVMLEPDEDLEIILGYARSIRNDCDIYSEPLYISNNSDTSGQTFDLSQGKGGYGIYLQIQ